MLGVFYFRIKVRVFLFIKTDNSLPTVVVLAAYRSERFKAAYGCQHKLDTLLQGRSVLERE